MFPIGFRFSPTDEELVCYYLRRKADRLCRFQDSQIICELELYHYEPWDLPGLSVLKSRDTQWFFFSPREKKYQNGDRINRATGEGYWKMTGKDGEVMHGEIKAGIKKTLVYYKGRAPHGGHTDWIMHEYRLTQNYEELKSLVSCHVLCKVFKKGGAGPRNGEKHGAPLIDEEELGSDISPKSQSNLFTLVAPELEPETSNWHFENQTKTSNWHIKDKPETSYRHIQNQPETSNWHIEDQPETSNRHIKNLTEKSYSHIQNQPEMIYTHIEDRPETSYRHMENQPEMSYRNIENQPKMSYMHIENQPEMSYGYIENHPETSDRNIENQTGASYRHIKNQNETNNRHIKSQPEMSYRLVQNQPDARNRHIKNPPETSYSYVENQPETSNRHIQNQIRMSNRHIENQSTKVLPLKPLLMQKLGKPSMPEHSPRKKARKELLSSLDMAPSSSGVCNEPNTGHENNCDYNSILEQMLLEDSSNALLPENHGGLDDDNDEWLDFLELDDLEEEGESSFPVASSELSSDEENPEETGILLRTSNKGGGDGEAARTPSQFNHKSRLRVPISSFGGAIACNRDNVANHQCRDILDLPPTGCTNFSTNMEKPGERMINHMDSNGDDDIQEFENVSKTCRGRIFRGSFHMNSDDEDNTTEQRIPEPKRSAKHGFAMNRLEPNILEKSITAFQYHDGFMSSSPEESVGGGFMTAVSGVGQCMERLLVLISTQVWRNFLLPYSCPTLFSRF